MKTVLLLVVLLGLASALDFTRFPSYKFEYGVEDWHTGDIKNQWEHRHGDQVEGGYTMKEADGSIRVVKYFASDKEGFRAIVKNVGKKQLYLKKGVPLVSL